MDIATLGIAVQADKVDRASTSLDRFSGSAKKAEGSARGIGAGATDASRRTVAANDNAVKSTNRLSGAFDAAKRYVIVFGAAAGAALVAAFLVRPVFEFRDALAEVSTLVDTATFDMAALENAALSQSAAFGGGAAAQVKAYYQIISAGASTAAEATETLTAANKLAIGGVTDIRTAADGLTSVLNAYGDKVEDATAVSDAMFVAMRAGKTTIGELSGALGRVAPLAAQTGVSFDELVASVAALTKGGISTSEAMTGVRAILAAIAKPASEATELANQLGIKFNAAALESKGLAGFLQELISKTRGSTEKLAMLFGGVEALVPVMALAGKAGDDFAEILEQMESKAGATQVAFDKMANSPGFQAGRVWSALQAEVLKLGNTMGTLLVPVMRALADHMEDIFKWAKVAGAALIVAFGPTILTAVYTLTTAVGVGLVGAFNALKAAMLRNPFGAFLVAVTIAITSLYQFRDEVKQAIGVDVIGYVLQAGNVIINSFRAAFADVVFIWKNFPDIMEAAVIGAVNRVIRGANDMIRTATAGIDLLIAKINAIPGVDISPIGGGRGIPVMANPAAGRLADPLAGHNERIQGIMGSDPLGANEIAKGVADGTKKLDDTVHSGFVNVGDIGKQFPEKIAETTSAVDGLKGSVDGSGDRITGALGHQTNALTSALDGISQAVSGVGQTFTSSLKLSVGGAEQKQIDALSRERDVISSQMNFKQLSPQDMAAAQHRLAEIDLQTAQLNQQMGEAKDALQSLKPMILDMTRAGRSWSQITQMVAWDMKRMTGNTAIQPLSLTSQGFGGGFAGGFADGGTIPRGMIGLVGERGPELIRGPAEITPLKGGPPQTMVTHNNDNSRGDVNISVNVTAPDGGGGSRESTRDLGRQVAQEAAYYLREQGII